MRSVAAVLVMFLAACGVPGPEGYFRLEWARQLPSSSGSAFGRAVAAGGGGGAVLVGDTQGAMPGQAQTGVRDLFLAGFAASGALGSLQQFGSGGDDLASGAAALAGGDVVLVGRTTGSLGPPNAGGADVFAIRHDGAGIDWATMEQSSNSDVYAAVTVDAAGQIFAAGEFDGEGRLRRLGATFGSLEAHVEPSGTNRLQGVAVHDGNAYVVWNEGDAGRVQGYDTLDLMDNTWVVPTFISNPGEVQAVGIAAGPGGELYAGGWTDGEFPGQVAAGGPRDGWVARLRLDGEIDWVRQFGTGYETRVRALTTDAQGNVLVTGGAYGSFDGAPGLVLSSIFLIAYSPAGELLGRIQVSSTDTDVATSVIVHGDSVYVGGHTQGQWPGQVKGDLTYDALLLRFMRN